QMHRRFGCFVGGSLLHFWHAVLRFDFVAAIFAEDATFGGFWRWHWGVDRYFAFGFDFGFHARNQILIFLRCQPLLFSYYVILKARDRIALAPELEHRLRNVAGGVVDGVAFHAHHFGFDQRGAFAAVGALNRFVGSVVDLAGVGAVNDHARDAVSDGPFGEVLAAILHL